MLDSILGVVGLALVGVAAGLGVLYARADTSTVGELAFANELKIPPLLEGQADGDRAKVFDLRLQTGTSELLPGKTTETWGINGPYLGPTLRVESGERVRMNVRNDLPEPTTVHWHGMHLPATADGGPHQPIARGETWSPAWTIDQPAATLWYHPHPHPDSDEQIYRGVAGMIVVDDPEADRLSFRARTVSTTSRSSSRTRTSTTTAGSTSRRGSSARPGSSARRSSSTVRTRPTSRSQPSSRASGS